MPKNVEDHLQTTRESFKNLEYVYMRPEVNSNRFGISLRDKNFTLE